MKERLKLWQRGKLLSGEGGHHNLSPAGSSLSGPRGQSYDCDAGTTPSVEHDVLLVHTNKRNKLPGPNKLMVETRDETFGTTSLR